MPFSRTIARRLHPDFWQPNRKPRGSVRDRSDSTQHLRLIYNSGNLRELSRFRQNFTPSNTTVKITDRGPVFNFNGTNSYVEIADNPALRITNALTVTCWIRSNVATQEDFSGIVVKRLASGDPFESYAINMDTLGTRIEFAVSNSTSVGSKTAIQSTTTIVQDEWMFIAAVFDGSNSKMRIYINGVEETSATKTGSIAYTNLALRLGHQVTPVTKYFDGQIDDVRIFDKVLTSRQIFDIYRNLGHDLEPATNFFWIPTQGAATDVFPTPYLWWAGQRDLTGTGNRP